MNKIWLGVPLARWLLVILVAGCFNLVACGGGGGSDSKPDSSSSSSSSSILNSSSVSSSSSSVVSSSSSSLVPVFIPGANQAVIYYKREDSVYTNWGLHIWNNEACSSLTAGMVAGITWDTPKARTGIDPNYGAYWVLDLNDVPHDCVNFIVHKGNEKALGEQDLKLQLADGYSGFTFHGSSTISYTPTLTNVSIEGASAHWAAEDTILWDGGAGAASVHLYYSETASLGANAAQGITGYDGIVDLTAGTPLSDEIYDEKFRTLRDLTPYTLGGLAQTVIKNLLRNQLAVVALDADGNVLNATYVQIAGALDDVYAAAEDEALGVVYTETDVSFRLWAPTAQDVDLQLYDAEKVAGAEHQMVRDNATGVWSITLPKADVDRLYYRYAMSVYHPITRAVESYEVTDPYSVSVSTNSHYSQAVNLDDDDLKPASWDSYSRPSAADPTDLIIYEAHIRDFSIRDESTDPALRGKYMAFTDSDSVPVQHLQSLADAGLNMFHVLPANDQANVEEDPALRIDLTNTVAQLCARNASAAVCTNGTNTSLTLLEVFEDCDPSTRCAETLANDMGGLDGFNWGYDPFHFGVPEGAYASNAEGVTRIREMREMIAALHQMGLMVALDVVYNHTSSSGLWRTSVLDRTVPGYYQRLNETSGNIESSTCCQNTATEHLMMAKLMHDTLLRWAEHYRFDAIRHDLMGHIPKAAVLESRERIRAVNPDIYFYGEGWNFGEVQNNRRFEQSTQLNMAGTDVGTFSDRLREAVRSGTLFNASNTHDHDITLIGLVGNVGTYQFQAASGTVVTAGAYQWGGQPAGYATNPADTINYVSKHDNETLWDILQDKLPSNLLANERARVHRVALSYPLLGQGVPFLHMGSELMRSKSQDRNSYNAGDWFNYVDFTGQTNNWDVGLPLFNDNQSRYTRIQQLRANVNSQVSPADIALTADVYRDLLKIRSGSKLFRLNTAAEVRDRIGFYNLGTTRTLGLMVMSIDDGVDHDDLDAEADAIVVVFNSGSTNKTYTIADAAGLGFELHEVQQVSADSVVQTASFDNDTGSFTVPARTTAVFVKPQSDERIGLPPQ